MTPSPFLTAVDVCAGPGGWDHLLRSLAISVVGIDNDPDTCRTRRAAGLATFEQDVRRVWRPARAFPAELLLSSPPCQPFSTGGKGVGRRALDEVLAWADKLDAGEPLDPDAFDDERTGLVLEPLRWVLDGLHESRPYAWVALEQVPSVRPVWERFAEILARRGYSVAVDTLSAEQYGVPQTRRRAFLVAALGRPVHLPTPRFRPYYLDQGQAEGDPALMPWVSMAEALDAWSPGDIVGFPRRADRGPAHAVNIAGVDYRARDLRGASLPSLAVTSKARSWVRWPANGSRAERLSIEEASILQGFPPDYPWHGSRTSQFAQVANAVPPPLAHAVLRDLIYGR